MIDNKELNAFKNQIIKYSVIVALLCEIVSLPFLGWNPRFAYGLTLGTCIAIANFNLLVFASKKALDRGKGAGLAFIGYIFRLFLYGGGFYMSYRLGTDSGLATLFGYLTLKIGMIYLKGFKPKFSESSAKGKNLNDLSNDQWAEEKKEKQRLKKDRKRKIDR
ncbi:MAG: ATP synthase subunit I [Eubacteriales bacterium]|nr:ATP synthase subunit I [Eubacteriales bacterium]MDD4582861.1 ATP synthase subunit I [Eubacteriales bacterium]